MEYKNIDKDKLATVKKLTGGLLYNVLETKKVCTVSSRDDEDISFDFLKENINYCLHELGNDVFLKNSNRDFINLGEKTSFDIEGLAKKILTNKEYTFFRDWCLYDYYDVIDDYYGVTHDFEYILACEPTEKNRNIFDRIVSKIEKNIICDSVKCTGYSQGDYDMYTIVYTKDLNKEKKDFLEDLKNALGYIFTASETSFKLETIEVRSYENGETVEEVIEKEYESVYNFDGVDSYKEVMEYVASTYKDYQIIDLL